MGACGIMTLVSFTAAAADQSQIGLDDPTDGAESPSAIDPPGDDQAEDRPTPDPTATEPSSAPAKAVTPDVTLRDDQILLARAAADEESGDRDLVGEYLGAIREDEIAITAAFAAVDRGYRGWYWSVTLAVVDPERPTISEVVLLPGDQSLLAPPWVPWDLRIRAGDVGAGDLLPTAPDDPRLVPGYVDSDDPAVMELAYEFGFGRVRVLSREGRDDAAQRWHDGPFGPDDAVARQAPAHCVSCGFYVPLAGLLGMTLGACTNEYSPADGRVVDAGYGCGAHSETVIDAPMMSASTDTVVDELTLEVHPRPARQAEPIDSGLDAEPEPVFDPEPDADPDLLQDVVLDPVLEALAEEPRADVVAVDVVVAEVEVAGAEVAAVDVVVAEAEVAGAAESLAGPDPFDQPSDVAWAVTDEGDSTP